VIGAHAHYAGFIDYGDAEAYGRQIAAMSEKTSGDTGLDPS
jgi:hypothetical protein